MEGFLQMSLTPTGTFWVYKSIVLDKTILIIKISSDRLSNFMHISVCVCSELNLRSSLNQKTPVTHRIVSLVSGIATDSCRAAKKKKVVNLLHGCSCLLLLLLLLCITSRYRRAVPRAKCVVVRLGAGWRGRRECW